MNKATYQFQETIFFNQPGTKPQDNVEYDALTFSDLEGNKATYLWKNGIPEKFDRPQYQSIQIVNFKSQYRPFTIFYPNRVTRSFTFGSMPDYSNFPCWNHWPVQQTPSDGRNAVAPDKPSHSSLTDSNCSNQIVEKGENNSYIAAMLTRMTTQPVDSLVALARSWNYPAKVNLQSPGFSSKGYDKYQRTYVLKAENPTSSDLLLQLEASGESPLHNLVLIIENWSPHITKIKLGNKWLTKGRDYQAGYVAGILEDKTLLYISCKSEHPVELRIEVE